MAERINKQKTTSDRTDEVVDEAAAVIPPTQDSLPAVRLVVCEPFVLRCGAVGDSWFPEFDQYRAAAKRVAEQAGAVGKFWGDTGVAGSEELEGFEENGGVGLDTHTYGLVIRELARADAGVAIMVAVHNSVGSFPLLRFGSDELKSKYLPRMAQGELGAFCVTEPGAGSDAASLTTRAGKVDGGYRITGEKIWVTNGYFAEFFVVMARTGDPGPKGISAFLGKRPPEWSDK